MSVQVLYIPDDPRWDAEIRGVDNWEDLAWMVGGAVDEIHVSGWEKITWQAFVNDDAKSAGMKFNSRATFLAQALGYDTGRPVHGPAVFVGPEEPDAEFLTDVKPDVIEQAGAVGMTIVPGYGANTIQVV